MSIDFWMPLGDTSTTARYDIDMRDAQTKMEPQRDRDDAFLLSR